MQPYQHRVVEEKAELDAKRAKLSDFFKMPGSGYLALPKAERDLLGRQARFMASYSWALGERIKLFQEDE